MVEVYRNCSICKRQGNEMCNKNNPLSPPINVGLNFCRIKIPSLSITCLTRDCQII